MNAMGDVLGLLCAKHDSNAPSAVSLPLPLSLFSTGLEERTYPICHSSWYLFFPPETQGAAPKKPYNPVLGEVFRCYWDIPGGKRTAPNADEQVIIMTFSTLLYM